MNNISDIVLLILGGIGAMFFTTILKNKSALKHADKSKEKLHEIELEEAVTKEKLAEQERKREELKQNLEKELNREVTNEELTDYFNKRYNNK